MKHKIVLHEHKRKQLHTINNLTNKVNNLEQNILDMETKTKLILLLDNNGFVKGSIEIDSSTNIKTSPSEVELPLDYKAGYYKFDEKTGKLVINKTKKKEYDESIIII